MPLRISLLTVMLTGLSCVNLAASPISGTFTIGGNITVTQVTPTMQTIDYFTLIANTPQKSNVGNIHTDDFSILTTGSQITIDDLDNGTEPMGTFSPQNFISFDTAPSMPTLLINQVFPGIFTMADCTATPAPGQTCTPNVMGTSNPGPFSLLNETGTPSNPIQSTVSFTLAGITSDGLSTWEAVLSSNFNQPFQTTLATFAATGSVTNTYAGTIIVTPNSITPVPEPRSLFLLMPIVALVGLRAGDTSGVARSIPSTLSLSPTVRINSVVGLFAFIIRPTDPTTPCWARLS